MISYVFMCPKGHLFTARFQPWVPPTGAYCYHCRKVYFVAPGQVTDFTTANFTHDDHCREALLAGGTN